MEAVIFKVKLPKGRKAMLLIDQPVYVSDEDELLVSKAVIANIRGYKSILSQVGSINIASLRQGNCEVRKSEPQIEKIDTFVVDNEPMPFKQDKSMRKKNRKKRKGLDNGLD